MVIIYSLCLCIFFVGMCGVFFSRTNILLVLMSLELMLLSVSILSTFSSILLDDLIGQLFTLFVLTIGASESAIGLALIVCYYNGYRYV
jgi:NADH-quinone oxidoreductase subunit K